MTRIQIGLTGRYQGRGFWRRVFGSGPVRITPIDTIVAESERDAVAAAANALQAFIDKLPSTDHRLGSLFDAKDVKPFIVVKSE